MYKQLLQKISNLRKTFSFLTVISFVTVLIITISFIIPKLNDINKLNKKNSDVKQKINEFENAIKELKKYPEISYYINSESDTKLLIKKLSKNFFLYEMTSGEDIGGKYIDFKWQITNYDNLKNIIVYLESIKRSFPICYRAYEMSGNTISVKGRIYYAI